MENTNQDTKRWRRVAIAFLTLWLLTGGVLTVLFVRGQGRPSSDGRTAIALTASEKDFVLMEMRRLLEAVHAIHGALATGKRSEAIEAARGAGMQMVREGAAIEQSLLLKLPVDMKALGIATHRQFDRITQMLESGASNEEISRAAFELSGHCVACHQMYRIE